MTTELSVFSRIPLAILGLIISSPNLEESHVFTPCGEHVFQVLQKHAKNIPQKHRLLSLCLISASVIFRCILLPPKKSWYFNATFIQVSFFHLYFFLFRTLLWMPITWQLPASERKHRKMQINLLFNRAKMNFSLTMGQQHEYTQKLPQLIFIFCATQTFLPKGRDLSLSIDTGLVTNQTAPTRTTWFVYFDPPSKLFISKIQ